MQTLLITIVPSIIIFLYFYVSDRFKEPKQTILIVFVLGILICFPAGIINDFIINNFQRDTDLSERLYSSFFTAAWVEELLKFLVLYYIVLRRHEFNEPMDGLVYGVTVSLGFATYENYSYVFYWANEWDIDPYQMAIWRSYSAIPLHGLCGCIMGFYFGLYSFTAKFKYLILSLLLPYLIHGFYNFFSHPYHFVVLGMSTIFVVRLHTYFKKEQFNKLREQETKKI